MGKLTSITKKASTILRDGVEPLEEGLFNYENPNPEIEAIAQFRILMCVQCEKYTDEPVDFLRVPDERIQAAADKMCGGCGCSLPMLLRQSKKICKVWKGQK